jgi:hypothetical protein
VPAVPHAGGQETACHRWTNHLCTCHRLHLSHSTLRTAITKEELSEQFETG